MATPAMLTKTATTFDTFNESWPRKAPIKSVKSPEVEDSTVVLATLVRARAAFEKYCKQPKTISDNSFKFLSHMIHIKKNNAEYFPENYTINAKSTLLRENPLLSLQSYKTKKRFPYSMHKLEAKNLRGQKNAKGKSQILKDAFQSLITSVTNQIGAI